MLEPHAFSSNQNISNSDDQPIKVSKALQEQVDQQKVFANAIARIRASLDVDTIFQATVTEVRQLLKAERVGVFRFYPESGWNHGEFIAEDVDSGFSSVLMAQIQDHCFGEQYAVHYAQGRIQAISDIYNAGFSDCHIQILSVFQVRANLIVPLLLGNVLWGLLCIHHCSAPREWHPTEIEFAKQIANHFNVALQQAQYVEQAKTQAALITQATEQEKALSRQRSLVNIANKIRQSFDLKTICQTATNEVRHLLEVDRATIYRFNSDWSGQFLFESRAAGWKPLVGVMPTIEDSYLMETQGGRYAYNETFAVNDIYQAGHSDCHIALLEEFQARAYAIAPIFQEGRLWGLLTAFQNSEPCCWHEDEVQLLAQIGEQLGIALQQAEYVERIQAQTEELNQILQELQQSQLKLIQQEKMASLGQLVAGVAHEINNPVNFIHANLGYVHGYAQNILTLIDLYQKYYPQAPEEIQEQAEGMDLDFILEDLPKTLASMKLGTDRIRQIVLSLRNFSRLDESEFKSVDIHEGIDSTLLMLGHRLKNTTDRWSIKVVKNYGQLPLIKCYPAKLNQVFMNLLANAIDAIEDAVNHNELGANTVDKPLPMIWISTQLTEVNQVEVRIRDNGLGIPDHVKTQIFDQFFTTKTVGKGTGLGLAISLQIITEKHHGTLQVNSEPGRGAEFIIHLPTELVSNQ